MNRGEVWLLNLDPTLGAEIQKMRPVVIISSDSIGVLPLRVIVPLIDWKERYAEAAWMVRIDPARSNGLFKPTAVDAFQVRSVSTSRFVRKLGQLNSVDLDAIIAALGLVVEAPLAE
jgi:mRNA interferase MazF